MSNPTLRFKSANGLNFPDTVSCTLSDISKYSKGTIERKNCLFIGNEQLVSNFGGATLEFRTEAKGTEFNNGDILFGNIRPYLKKVWLSDQSGIASPDVLIFKVTDSIPGYLKCILSSERFFNHVAQGYKGSKMPRGDKHQIMDFRIQCPCLEEQQKIASFFSTLDQKIELNERKLEVLEKLKKGLMQKFFKQELRFKSPETKDYPEWEVQKLEKLCSTFKSGSSITQKSIFEAGDYPVYGGNGLRGYTDTYTHDGEYALIGRQGALCGNLKYVKGKTYISEHAIAVQANSENSTQWLYYRLKEMNLNKLSESSAQPGLSAKKLKAILINTPCLEEQIRIAKFFARFDEKIKLCTNKLFMLQQLKRSLLQQMFV